jgi:hypothetical protein
VRSALFISFIRRRHPLPLANTITKSWRPTPCNGFMTLGMKFPFVFNQEKSTLFLHLSCNLFKKLKWYYRRNDGKHRTHVSCWEGLLQAWRKSGLLVRCPVLLCLPIGLFGEVKLKCLVQTVGRDDCETVFLLTVWFAELLEALCSGKTWARSSESEWSTTTRLVRGATFLTGSGFMSLHPLFSSI